MRTATCIGCRCTDFHACQGEDGPCSWLAVDYGAGLGVCSGCPDQLKRWQAGERSVLMLVAKITREGESTPFFIESNDMASFPLLLDVEPGDKFAVEWLEMSSNDFEALPQFEQVRLARQWLAECQAAAAAEKNGLTDQARVHQAEGARIAAAVAAAGYEVTHLAQFL
ncbi:MAG: hypothetical protein OEL20_05275 [Sulfuritalea sp.]|nr:hypothetical protein [Sulfuritalea sp.]